MIAKDLLNCYVLACNVGQFFVLKYRLLLLVTIEQLWHNNQSQARLFSTVLQSNSCDNKEVQHCTYVK